MALIAAANGRAAAPVAAFATGFASSFGPCVAPRFIALSTIATGSSGLRGLLRVLAFVFGLVLSSVALAAGVSFATNVWRLSGIVYTLLSAALALFGMRCLFVDSPSRCIHGTRRDSSSIGAAFLLGSSFAFVVSPCCSPFIATLAVLAGSGGSALFSLSVLAAFAAGHALPLLIAGCSAKSVRTFIEVRSLSASTSIVSGGLSLALAAYYALLV